MTKKYDDSASAQRKRLHKRLQAGPCSTLEARHELDILGVAPRIFELRHQYGLNIQTHWIYGINPGGKGHRVAQYVLFSGQFQEEK